MGDPKYKPKKLIVEGNQDKRVIPWLMVANGITWETEDGIVVDITTSGGVDNITAGKIKLQLQESALVSLGLIVDADEDADNRWTQIRGICSSSISDLPDKLPATGLVHLTAEKIKFGVWIMPDNSNRGMLETFLNYLIPDNSESLWQYAQEVTQSARQKGANFKKAHIDKANIYSWLAWQDPPGQQLHDAVRQKILNPNHPKAHAFVTWFKELYDL